MWSLVWMKLKFPDFKGILSISSFNLISFMFLFDKWIHRIRLSLSTTIYKNAKTKILDYIANIIITEDELENIVSSYPLEAQVKFYKIGGQYAVTYK